MARRSHAKTRTGCATCKARRIKCKEEQPNCRNCIKHGVQCPGYTDVQKNAIRVRKPRSNSKSRLAKGSSILDKSEVATQPHDVFEDSDDTYSSTTTRSPVGKPVNLHGTDLCPPSPHLESWPGSWHRDSIVQAESYMNRPSWTNGIAIEPHLEPSHQAHRMNSMPVGGSDPHQSSLNHTLLQAFSAALELVPSVTFSSEAPIWHDIYRFAAKWTSVMESILSFASTYLHFITQDQVYARAAIVHRGLALQRLQCDMRCGREGVDAAVASSILLADQAAFEGDWRSSILHHKGLANLCMQHLHVASDQTRDSIFSQTRAFDPEKRLPKRRRIDIETIRSTPDGLDCYSSLELLKDYFFRTAGSSDTTDPDFLGLDRPTPGPAVRHVQFHVGGLGHLLTLACDVHELHWKLSQQAANSDEDEHFLTNDSLIMQCKTECNTWLTYLPQSLVSGVFEGDPAALMLLAYKSSLELLLYRCTLLHKGGAQTMPSPGVVMSIAYIRHCHQVLSAEDEDGATTTTRGPFQFHSKDDKRMFMQCMNWPLWVMNWATPFIQQEKIMAAATNSEMLIFSPESVHNTI